MDRDLLKPEEYLEPACPLCMKQPEQGAPLRTLPVGRVLERLDRYLEEKDYAAAERHLAYWVREAEDGRDLKGKLSLLNEQIGFYRKQEREEEALRTSREALDLVRELGMEDSLSAGTAYINAATAFKAFGRAPEALPLFERAETIYTKSLPPADPRLGGLYNNWGLALYDCGRCREAENAYRKALSVMEAVAGSEPEQAITLLNLADCASAQGEEARLFELLEEAETLLKKPELVRDSYFRYAAGRCAPVFDYYGCFAAAAEVKKLAEEAV